MMSGRLAAAMSLAAAATAAGSGSGARYGRERRHRSHFGLHAEDVPRRLNRHRPHASAPQLTERFGHDGARFGRMVDALGPFRQATQQSKLVRQLMELAAPLADQVGLDVAGDAQHRRRGTVGGAQCGAGIEHTGSWHDGAHADAAGRLGVAIRHVTGALLVARGYEA